MPAETCPRNRGDPTCLADERLARLAERPVDCSRGVEGHGDRAVGLSRVHRRVGRLEASDGAGRGMAVGVRPHRDDRVVRPRPREEGGAGRVGRAVVGDLEEVQRRATGADAGHVVLGRAVVVAGEQHPMAVDVEQQDDAVGVGIAAIPDGIQHLGRKRPEVQRMATEHRDDLRVCRVQRGDEAPVGLGLADVVAVGDLRAELLSQGRQVADVVGVGVGGQHHVEAADSEVAKLSGDGSDLAGLAAIDRADPGAVLDNDAVALAHVDEGDRDRGRMSGFGLLGRPEAGPGDRGRRGRRPCDGGRCERRRSQRRRRRSKGRRRAARSHREGQRDREDREEQLKPSAHVPPMYFVGSIVNLRSRPHVAIGRALAALPEVRARPRPRSGPVRARGAACPRSKCGPVRAHGPSTPAA